MLFNAPGTARAVRLTFTGLLLAASVANPLAQNAAAIELPQQPPLMEFLPDAYPRLTTPVQQPDGQMAYPLKTTRLAADNREVLADRLIVRFAPSAAAADLTDIHTVAKKLGVAAPPVGQVGPYSFLVDVSGKTLEEAASIYKADARVLGVGPDTLVQADETPNDTRFGEQWGMHKIQAPAAWNRSHGEGAGRIAILDSGINEAHPELAGRIVARRDFTDSSSGTDDVNGHGTHVAGIAGAIANNSQGVAGMGYSVFMLNGKVLDDSGSGSVSQLIRGIRWARDNNASVINMSLGANSQHFWDDCDPGFYEEWLDIAVDELKDAINSAHAKGIVLVAAAGNNGNGFQQWPAACTNVLSVANTTQTDGLASNSTRGSWVDVAAPGSGILSTSNAGSFVSKSGTSMAAPHVAGLAALVKGSCGFSGATSITAQSIVNRITSTTDQITGTGSLFAFGRVNALKAVCFPKPGNLRVGTIGMSTIQLLWNDTTPGESRFELSHKPAGSAEAPSPKVTLAANTETFTHTGVAAGTVLDYNVRGCDANGCSDWSNTVRAESNAKKLTVVHTGAGNTKGAGINCGSGASPSDCTETYSNGTTVTLTAKPFVNQKLEVFWIFDHWEGACSGTAPTCTLTMNGNKTVRAVFTNDE